MRENPEAVNKVIMGAKSVIPAKAGIQFLPPIAIKTIR